MLLSKKAYKNFLATLKDVRISHGLTQSDLASRLKSTQSFISKVERGERRLDVVELRQWCKAIRVDFAKFVKSVDISLEGDR
jgi:transcriptional regulator with XRE-family HTH domain